MIYLVGENIDKARAHSQAKNGLLLQLMRGVYVSSTAADIEVAILRHAIRIARYISLRSYLSGASAILLAPTSDGRLFISGPRNQRTRLRSLEIIQNTTPAHPSVASAVIDDGLGEFRVDVSSPRMRLLEAFRIRSEHATSIDADMRTELAERLLAEYGTTEAAANALWSLASENGWYREGKQAERYLHQRPVRIKLRNEAAIDLTVAWHGQPIGLLSHDGFEWRWRTEQGFNLPLVQQRVPGKLPPFILSLLPEGWLRQVLRVQDERMILKSGKRYMSNITITAASAQTEAEPEEAPAALPADRLVCPLATYTCNGLFTGVYTGPRCVELERNFEDNLALVLSRPDSPRISGIQIKAPMFLDEHGLLSSSTGQPFTHILKPAGTGGFGALPVIEYLAVTLGRHVGLDAPDIALVPMPDGMPPALLIERFDIRTDAGDRRQIALEDLCSVLNLSPDAKYTGTIEGIARAIRSLSTSPDEDLLLILKRALFAWLIADGDMHLKNVALLKIASPGASSFQKVRLGPLYDAVTTRVFPGLESDRMALKLNGKDDRLRRSDFLRFASTAGILAGRANTTIDEMLERFGQALDDAYLPNISLDHDIKTKVDQMLTLCRKRLDTFR